MLSKCVLCLLILWAYGGTSICFLIADDLHNSPEDVKKYNLSICTVFKNKATDLKEWIEYHRILGADHFYLYNIASSNFCNIIVNPYIDEGVVTLVNWPEIGKKDGNADAWANTEISAYENAVNFLAREETKWLLFLDLDEFLTCPHVTITELLEKYDDCASITLSSEVFVKAKRLTLSKNKSSNESLGYWRSQDTENINRRVIKMILKPDLCVGFVCPPYECRFKPNQSSVKIDRQQLRIVRYVKDNILNLRVDKEITYMQDDDYRPISSEAPSSFWNEDTSQNQILPVYEKVPEFLRKLQKFSLDKP